MIAMNESKVRTGQVESDVERVSKSHSERCSGPEIQYLTDEQLAADDNFGRILCPLMRLGVRSKQLTMDDSGGITEKELLDYLRYLGINPDSLVIRRVVNAAKSSPNDDCINMTRFKGTLFDHGSTSGAYRYEVLDFAADQKVSKEAVEVMLSHSRDGESMELEDFASATNSFHRCPFKKMKTSVFGVLSSTFEYALLLHFLGRKTQSGSKFLTLDDVRRVWVDNKFPIYWNPPQVSNFGTRAFIVKTLVHGWVRLDMYVKNLLHVTPKKSKNSPTLLKGERALNEDEVPRYGSPEIDGTVKGE